MHMLLSQQHQALAAEQQSCPVWPGGMLEGVSQQGQALQESSRGSYRGHSCAKAVGQDGVGKRPLWPE